MKRVERHQATFSADVELFEREDGWHARLCESPELDIAGATRDEAFWTAQAVALRRLAERADERAAHSAVENRFPGGLE